jgi:two-component system phosphate regulon sensor histidine kinase PhoR
MSAAVVIALVLAAALGWALRRLRAQVRATRHLAQAIARQQPLLREELSGDPDAGWAALRESVNDLLAEAARLRQLSVGQLAQLEATLGSLREAVLVIDASNRVVLANAALDEIFPRATPILGQRLDAVLRGVDFLRYAEAVRQGAAAPQRQIEFVEGDRSVWVEATGSPIPSLDGSREAWALFVLHDITRQKRLETVRRDFVANVSHELRTPLSVIKGYVETLADGHRDIAPDDREKFLRTVQRHTERLNSLLDDLLALSRLESANPGVRHEPTDLATLLTAVLDDYRARPAAARHRLDADLAPGLPALALDPLKITQAVENLLDNALKYTPPGSRITIRLAARDAEAVVSVLDDGPGIPAADLPHLFERFYRVDKGRSREKGGTGLGLSIVKHIVQLHGGRAWAASEPGQGSAFHLALPLAAAAPPSS